MNIHILTTTNRADILKQNLNFWQEIGWQTHIEYNDNCLPALGRNRILKQFYNSDQEWLCMADDDTILSNKWGSFAEFIRNPLDVLAQLPKCVSTVIPMNPIWLRPAVTLKQPIYQTHWRFERDFTVTGKLVFHRRTSHQFYQRLDLDAWEDAEWAFQQLVVGYHCVRLNNIVLREITGKSSLFLNAQDRNIKYQKSKEKLIALYPELYSNDAGHFIRKQLVKKYLKYPNRFIDIPYDTTGV